MMLAEASNNDVITWGIILVLTSIAANIAVIIGTRRVQKREVSFEFTPASKEEFDEHVAHNTDRHAQLFNKIEAVERNGRQELERRLASLNEERRQTLEKLNDQFTFIREHISAINTELKIRHQK